MYSLLIVERLLVRFLEPSNFLSIGVHGIHWFYLIDWCVKLGVWVHGNSRVTYLGFLAFVLLGRRRSGLLFGSFWCQAIQLTLIQVIIFSQRKDTAHARLYHSFTCLCSLGFNQIAKHLFEGHDGRSIQYIRLWKETNDRFDRVV